MIFAVPVFKDSFASLGEELPAITQFVIDASNFFTNWWWLLVVIAIGLFILVKVLKKKSEAFRLKWSELGIKLPVIGRINLMSAASEYAGTMSVMMSAGLPIVRAVGVTARSMTNYFMAHSLENTLPELEAGKTLATALRAENTLPELAIEMTSVGEQTGALEGTLVNSVGAGDSTVAGFVHGYLESHDYAHAFKMALVCGAATAFSEGLAPRETIDELLKR